MSLPEKDIVEFIGALKHSILQSQYNAARLVNTQLVQLYFFLGAAISQKVKQANWGDKVLETVSAELQKELKHLKGFSAQNLKKMKIFYEAYPSLLAHCPLAHQLLYNADIQNNIFGSPVANQIENTINSPLATELGIALQIGSAVPNQFEEYFWAISFTNHFSILNKAKTLDERLFYVSETAKNNWSSRVLENHLKNRIYSQRNLPNNFEKQLPAPTQMQAIAQFRDEYLLDFLSIDDSDDERLVENKIVQNIRDFLLNLGTGFSFIGNQYKLVVENEEFFIDLLFYNRTLQSLVAIELKRGKFKPEHLGQISFYLAVLDEKIRLPNENPSIGIVLCKEKNNTVVEYALRNAHQPLGVATYKTKNEMPGNLKNVLPGAEDLRKIMG